MARALAKIETGTVVLEAAKKVLRQKGYAKLSTRDVAAVAGVPVAADAHQHFDPLGHEHHLDALRRQRRVAHQILRVEADRIAEAVVAGAGKAEAAAPKVGVGLIEANFLPVAGAELGGGRAEPAGGDVEFVLDDAEQ